MDLLFENVRPVNNLPFVAKVTEKAVSSQLLNHYNENAPLPVSQSAYRQCHSTETALLKVQNDILINNTFYYRVHYSIYPKIELI